MLSPKKLMSFYTGLSALAVIKPIYRLRHEKILRNQMHIIAPGSQEEKQMPFKVSSQRQTSPAGTFHKTLLFFRIWEYALWGQNPPAAVKRLF
jgi:hypothetical protein